jgi:hypothetical protein
MRSILLPSAFFILFCPYCFGQTKRIEFKSHSGNSENYHPEEIVNSNFGIAPSRFIQKARLDSLIYVNADTSILVTSNCDVNDNRYGDTLWWKPGREYAIRHPLFSKQYELQLIKETLKKEYNFRNPIDKVKFIGFYNGIPKKMKLKTKKVKSKLVFLETKDKQSKDLQSWAILTLFGLSIGGLAYYGKSRA